MQTVAATVIDVAREFQAKLQKVAPILAAAFVEYIPQRSQVLLSTLIDAEDPKAESTLAQIELELEDSFKEFSMDFSTTHLRGRDPKDFIPADAFVVYRRSANRADAQ